MQNYMDMGTEYLTKPICLRRAAATAVAVAFALGTALVSPAGAHAAYKESSPANKTTVSSPPSSVWAEYTEPPAQSSYLRVYDPCGRRVDNGDSQATGYRVTISMSASTKGTYRVDWAVLSTFDGHHTRGSFTFTSSSGEACPGAPEEEPSGEQGSGGGGQGEPSGEGGGGGGGETEAAPESPGSADEEVAAAESNGRQKKNKKPDRPAKRSGKNKASEEPNDGGESVVFGAAPRPATAQEERPRSGEMPLDGLAIGLLLAALIGAAGGYIYAGIMGPKR